MGLGKLWFPCFIWILLGILLDVKSMAAGIQLHKGEHL